MVNVAVADLITMGNNGAVAVAEGTFHEIIVEIAQNYLYMFVLPRGNIRVAEFIIAPPERRRRVVLWHPEFYVVARVVKTARNVNIAVAIRVENGAILIDKFLREICARVRVAHRDKRDSRVIRVTVAAPDIGGIFANFGATHIGIIEIHRVL